MKQNKNENVCPKNSLDFMDRETGGKIIEEKRGKVVVYARVSSTSDRQNTERQVLDLTSYANGEGLFEEHTSGAKKLNERVILSECLDYCVKELLVSELSRLGRSTLQVLRSIEILHNAHVGVYVQNIGVHSLKDDGCVTPAASFLITVLSEVASIERTNIQYRLNSGLKVYVENGGKVGRKTGSVKSREQKMSEYKDAINCLRKGYSIRDTAKLCYIGASTVQRIKKEFADLI